ncbi:alpha/beta hydrolase [Sediminibacillus albus]|uniref:Alpha/beta hydrolase fold n=1 Tax=Sediminibacillus albus TaxID=407036 RepID=A0A1G8X4X6_9BACI|nr:alpha/beta hydrolase [Sediminibacillus albus]SDJ85699.1 alpha/beta hydrolase fold [Sediminibacillus albus]
MRVEKRTFQTKLNTSYAAAYLWEDSEHFKTGEKRPVVVVCPGGGYRHTSDREADPVALKYFSEGFHVVILRYTCISEKPLFPAPHKELGQTILWIRENAEAWHVDLANIVLTGFSAGGHLACTFATEREWIANLLDVYKESLRFNHLVLCYPVINFTYGWPNQADKDKKMADLFGNDFDKQVKERLTLPDQFIPESMPRTFIWHTVDDASVPVDNSLKLMMALRDKSVTHEAHFFESGVHGLALSTSVSSQTKEQENEYCEPWFDLAVNWLKKSINT